jgi:hypothetical protein
MTYRKHSLTREWPANHERSPAAPFHDPGLAATLARLEAKVDELIRLIKNPEPIRTHYNLVELAKLLDLKPGTLRIWCRMGRINAERRAERAGGSKQWRVSLEEVARYQNDGLLEIDPKRNK